MAALGAVLFSLALVLRGGQVLDEVEPPPLDVRLGRFVSYFTIQSNLLVGATATMLARDPVRDGPAFRVLRMAGVVGITITGVVHFLLLRPLLDLHGADLASDTLLHLVVPALAVAGWALAGPRPRVDRRALGRALAWPLAWLAWTLAVGRLTGWYPYPFLDVDEKGWGRVLLAAAGVTALFLACFAAVALVDRRAPAAPRAAAARAWP